MNRQPTFSELRQGAIAWIRDDLERAARHGAVSFAVSWVVNFAVITTRGGFPANLIGTVTKGSETSGTFSMAVISLAITALVVYGMNTGWSSLGSAVRAVPGAIIRMFRQNGIRMGSIVFWAAGMALLVSGAISPTVSGALGLGFLALTPTAITGLVGRIITRIWVAIISFFAPKAKPDAPGLGGQLVGVFGWSAGLLVATQATDTAVKLIAAAVLAVLAHLVVINTPSRPASAAAVFLMGVGFWLGLDGVAQAFQGCCGEAHAHVLDPGIEAVGYSVWAGVSAAAGGVVGAGIGSVLSRFPQDPSTWDDLGVTSPDAGAGPDVTDSSAPEPDPVAPEPTPPVSAAPRPTPPEADPAPAPTTDDDPPPPPPPDDDDGFAPPPLPPGAIPPPPPPPPD